MAKPYVMHGAQALDRFARFEAFVRDDTKRQAETAAKAYADRLDEIRKVIPAPLQLARQLRYIRDTLRDNVTVSRPTP